ncbi:MAG: hypothetical protein KF897_11105 [Opitutaceae bacterium]|nr:hypothetical protein [Opitutaceae bacterium]
MSLPETSPKLNKWFFLLSDALLIAVAAFIAANSARPLSNTAILAIVACVSLGAVVTAAALIADYVRKQEESLDDRQRALEALSRTVATSAEQISIATSGLSEIGDHINKSLKHAEHLPHKLQERINDFTRQLNEAAVNDNEALQQEINSLRASEAEKLEAAGDRIAKTAAELVKLESVAAKHAAAAQETLARLPDAFAKARTEAEAALHVAQNNAVHALEQKFAALIRILDTKLAALDAAATRIPEKVTMVAAPAPAPVTEPAPVESAATPAETPVPAATPPAGEAAPAPADEVPHAEPKPRKPRAPRRSKIEELSLPMPGDNPDGTAPEIPAPPPLEAPAETATEPAAEPVAAPAADEFTQLAPDEAAPTQSVSADGATRLLVTAYIGIGNRLFIRGDGPGLSPDKGIPLQFVSIGKWRWETTEANGAVQVRLFKNDETECTSLGPITLEAGQQTEVTANF